MRFKRIGLHGEVAYTKRLAFWDPRQIGERWQTPATNEMINRIPRGNKITVGGKQVHVQALFKQHHVCDHNIA